MKAFMLLISLVVVLSIAVANGDHYEGDYGRGYGGANEKELFKSALVKPYVKPEAKSYLKYQNYGGYEGGGKVYEHEKQEIKTPLAPPPVGAYSQAIRVSSTVYISGQIAIDPASGRLVLSPFEAQTEQVFRNLRAVCEASGASLDRIVKLTVFITDLRQFPAVNRAIEKYFQRPYPARSSIEVSALPRGVGLEVEAILQL
ncbi:unnamed protein product [Medioppia subpectinata]|uniref:Uncharacterized protein n=1 Tax=Medioppia subpectinata TaxID=1979941 RepID=A0A7R9L2J3_9ACAR|nr:unnamed protein product [Medioppia subpectinata]CAG2113139.1 unnamed protein product [Medioppia subpectinata]